jgi:two-component system, NarL family, nitrate/nitrite response regulator NarL
MRDGLDSSLCGSQATVLVCASVRIYRDGVADGLRHAGLTVVGTAARLAEAGALARDLRPEILLVDVSAEEIEGLRALGAAAGETILVALGVPEQEESVIACAEAGVAAFVTRDCSLEELVAILESALRGETVCSPRMARALLGRVAALAAAREPEPSATLLTAREAEILDLIDEGLSNKQIAARLFIELPTVKNHVHSILAKLNVSRRAEAVRLLHQQAN